MKLEHIAFNVTDAPAVAAWYVQHCRLQIVRHIPQPNQTHFLADDDNHTLLEIYNNRSAPVPDYREMNPLVFHLALQSENAEVDARRFIKAGCTRHSETRPDANSHLIMLRDPWGLAIQICQRSPTLV